MKNLIKAISVSLLLFSCEKEEAVEPASLDFYLTVKPNEEFDQFSFVFNYIQTCQPVGSPPEHSSSGGTPYGGLFKCSREALPTQVLAYELADPATFPLGSVALQPESTHFDFSLLHFILTKDGDTLNVDGPKITYDQLDPSVIYFPTVSVPTEIDLAPGEARTVIFQIDLKASLKLVDPAGKYWIEPRIYIR